MRGCISCVYFNIFSILIVESQWFSDFRDFYKQSFGEIAEDIIASLSAEFKNEKRRKQWPSTLINYNHSP